MVQDPQQAIPKLQISSAFTLVFLVLLGSSSKSIATGLSVGASGGRASLGGYASVSKIFWLVCSFTTSGIIVHIKGAQFGLFWGSLFFGLTGS